MTNDAGELRLEHARLAALVANADEAYHSGDQPVIDDAEYDPVKRRLAEIEALVPGLAKGSPTARVGAKPRPGLAKVRHDERMISLDNAFTDADVEAFVARVSKATDLPVPRFVAEPKIDGLSLGVRYEGGRLLLAATRGDSEEGEDVTANARLISGVPHEIPFLGKVEVRGEAFMTKSDLAALNARQEAAGEKTFANCRNAAAGAIRNLDQAKARSRPLHMFGYSMIGGPACRTQEELLATIYGWGFAVSEHVGICDGADQLVAYHAHMTSIRAGIDYDLDGVVYKLDDLAARLGMGETSRTPRWAIAHKFEAEKAVTKLLGIVIQVGRTGVLTPRADLAPVSVGGVTVSSATLHNAEEIQRKDVRPGDMVTIQRAGDVIPQVLGHVAGTRDPSAPAYVFPTHCPSCGSPAVKVPEEVAIRCSGAFSCPAQRAERLRYMTSREVLNVDGLGEGVIETLVGAGLLDRPGDVFRLPAAVDRIAALPGMGRRSAELIAEAVERRRDATLDRYISALGVRMLGESKAKLVAAKAGTVYRFLADAAAISAGDAETAAAYKAIDGVGDALVQSIAQHFAVRRNAEDAADLAALMRVAEFKVATGPLTGMTIVFSGTLVATDRKAAQARAEALGAKVSGSVSKKTSLLVAGPGAGAKLADAEKHKVRVVDEAGWLEIAAGS